MSEDFKPVTDESIIKATAADYANYFSPSGLKFQDVDESIETVLTRLDELYGMLDMIRKDNALTVEELIPEVQAKVQSLNPIFQQIDKLEAFVEVVKKDVAAMEKDLKEKETDFSTFNSLKKTFSRLTFMGLKKTNAPEPSSSRGSQPYIAPPVFATSSYIHKQLDTNDTFPEVTEQSQD